MFEDIVKKPITGQKPKSPEPNCDGDCDRCEFKVDCEWSSFYELWGGFTPSTKHRPLGVPGWKIRLEDKIKKYLPNVRTKMK